MSIERSSPERGIPAPRELENGSPIYYIQEFPLPVGVENSLSENQKKTLSSLIRAARRWSQLYTEYGERSDPRVPFYPEGVTKRAVLRAAESNPEITSHYTMVSKSEDGDLVAVPMHKFYGEKIKKAGILDLLRRAAGTAGKSRGKDKELQRYLEAKAKSLETGNFEVAERIWLEREDEPLIDIVIGFYDTYSDRFLGIKYSAEAWVGVLDSQSTHDAQWFLDSFLNSWQGTTGKPAPKVKIRIDHTRIQSGQAAKYEWVGNNLPCQPKWRAEMGSKFIIFEPVFEYKFLNQQLPNFRESIDQAKILGITDNFVKVATLREHIAHETSHALVPGENIQQRLQEHSAWLKELYCDLLALTGYRRLKNLSIRESEIAMAMVLSKGYLEYQDQRKRPDYHKASTVFLSYLLKTGNISLNEGRFTWGDTEEVFKNITNLLMEVQKLLKEGKVTDAQQFHGMHFDPTIYRPLLLERLSRN